MKFRDLREFEPTLSFLQGEDINVEGITGLEVPRSGHLIFLGEAKYYQRFEEGQEKGLWSEGPYLAILGEKFWEKAEQEQKEKLKKSFSALGTVKNIPLAMGHLSEPFYKKVQEQRNDLVDGRQMGTTSIHPTAWLGQNIFIGANVTVEADAKIYPGCVIMSHSTIGKGSVLYPNVTIYPDVSVGKNCRIHGGVVLGSDGFGYQFHQGVHHKIWHFGGLKMGDNVEVGSNSCVDGGTFSPTVIGQGCKIDNQVQIGHNCHLGEGVVLCGQVAIGGSTKIGAFTVFGGKAGAGHDIELAPQTEVGGAAMVNSSWKEKCQLGGHPARPLKEWLRGLAFVRKESLKK